MSPAHFYSNSFLTAFQSVCLEAINTAQGSSRKVSVTLWGRGTEAEQVGGGAGGAQASAFQHLYPVPSPLLGRSSTEARLGLAQAGVRTARSDRFPGHPKCWEEE